MAMIEKVISVVDPASDAPVLRAPFHESHQEAGMNETDTQTHTRNVTFNNAYGSNQGCRTFRIILMVLIVPPDEENPSPVQL